MLTTELGEMPKAEAEPPEPPPGGVDAVVDELYDADPVAPDLPSALNPHVDVPEPVTEGEDTSTAATEGDDSEPQEESPA